MDKTQVISSNGTPYDKMFKSPNGLKGQKTVLTGCVGGGQMYQFCDGNGQPQILMKTQSMMTASKMLFVPPNRSTKATLLSSMHDFCPTKIQTKNVSYCMPPQSDHSDMIRPQQSELYASPQSGPDIVTKLSYASMNSVHPRLSMSTVITEQQFIKRTSGPIIEQNPKFLNIDQNHIDKSTYHGNSKGIPATTNGESKTLVDTLKNVFSFFMKPFINTTTSFVDTDNNGKSTSNSDNSVWDHDDTKATAGGSPMVKKTINQNHMKSSPNAYDDYDHSSDSFCFMSENSDYFMNYTKPDTFFDCDDYIDGGEDTIDFVAETTNLQYNRFDANLDTSAVQHPSPKDPIYYDCVNKCETPEMIGLQEDAKQKRVADDYLDVVCSTKITDDSIVENVQYNEKERQEQQEDEELLVEKSPMNCPKYVKPNPKSYRRKRRGKRQQQQQQQHHKANNRAAKGNGQKNRHEKIRHEVEQNIHEDIDDCSVVKNCSVSFRPNDDDDDYDEADLEIIDVDDDHLTMRPCTSNAAAATIVAATGAKPFAAIKSTDGVCIETPIPSPETIKSGCIFTQFFRLDKSNCKQKSLLPLRWMTQKQVPPQSKPMNLRERPVTCRRTSETSESDDSFIVFEDNSPKSTCSIDDLVHMLKSSTTTIALKDTYKRQRQISECSDDFILFEDDTDDLCRRYDTTDEDFTDSTDDDSDNSEDESGDESDNSDCSSISRQKHDGESNQPDSGFEEKKVTFNLCPKVHEIRAWKFAYSQARKGKWEQMGRDRERFEKRINGLSRVLSPILASDHRQQIYEQRFRSEE